MWTIFFTYAPLQTIHITDRSCSRLFYAPVETAYKAVKCNRETSLWVIQPVNGLIPRDKPGGLYTWMLRHIRINGCEMSFMNGKHEGGGGVGMGWGCGWEKRVNMTGMIRGHQLMSIQMNLTNYFCLPTYIHLIASTPSSCSDYIYRSKEHAGWGGL